MMRGRTTGGRIFQVCILGCAVLLAMIAAGCEKEVAKVAPPPVEVNAVTVTPTTIPVEVSFVAQVESSHQVEIVARVNGFLEKILYKEGEVVKQGQTMFLMDQKPFQAQVEEAKGALANQEAQLWTAKANLNRVKPLAGLDAASKSDLDNAIGSVNSAEAAVHQAQARLAEAELNLSYTVIKSPVTGVSGEARVREGAYLNVGTGGDLSYVAQLDPVWVTFSVSQNQFAKNRQEIAEGLLIPPPNQEYTVEIYLSDGTRYPHLGRLSFVDPSFSRETATFQIKAEFPNKKALLRPGMFVRSILQGSKRPNALVVPQRAVQQTANGHVVFVVSDQSTAEVRPVMVGEWVGQDWVVNKGLNPGEQIITDGFMRLAPGMPVKVVAAEVAGQAKTEAKTDPSPSAQATTH